MIMVIHRITESLIDISLNALLVFTTTMISLPKQTLFQTTLKIGI